MTRHRSLLASAVIGEHYSIFHDAERVIADPLVRNRGTIGGSLCQADPAEDLSAVVAAIRADLVLRSSGGSRVVPAREFTDGPYDTVLDDAEMLVEVRLPDPAGRRQRLREGGATGRRLGGRLGRRLPGAGRRHGQRRRHRAGRARRRSRLRPGRRGLFARKGTHRRDDRRGRPTGGGLHQSERRSARAGHLQTPLGERTHPAGSPPFRRPRAGKGLTCRSHHGERRRTYGRGRVALAAGALSPRHVAAHRNPLGLRHLAVRDMRGLAGRGTGEDLHGAGRDGGRAPGADGGGTGGRRQARPGPRGLHERTRPAVRVLHAGHDDDRPAPARSQSRSGRIHYPTGNLGPDLPLHRLREHRPRGPRGRRSSVATLWPGRRRSRYQRGQHGRRRARRRSQPGGPA